MFPHYFRVDSTHSRLIADDAVLWLLTSIWGGIARSKSGRQYSRNVLKPVGNPELLVFLICRSELICLLAE